jgi:hypothetical protein
MSANITATGSITKALPSIPLSSVATWGEIARLYSDPGYKKCFLHISSGATATPRTYISSLNALPGVATWLESCYYLDVEKIFVETFSPEDASVLMVGLTPNQALNSATAADIFKFTTHVATRGSSLTPGSNIAELPFYQGLSRQLSPTPVDGIMPKLAISYSSPTAKTGMCTICVICRVRGDEILHVDI